MRAHLTAFLLVVPLVAGCDCGGQVQKAHGILTMSPKTLDFGLGCLGATSEQQLVLTNDGNLTITLDAAATKVTNGAFALLEPLPETIDPGAQVVVRLGFTPTNASQFSGQFQLASDADEGGHLTATLVGNGSDLPDVDFEVTCGAQFQTCSFLAFDDVPEGGSADAVARLENNGCGPLTINELSFYPDPGDVADGTKGVPYFSTPNDKAPFVIRGGAHRDVSVHFAAPVDEEQPPVRMRIVSTDPAVKNSPDATPGVWDLGMFANTVGPSLLVDTDRLTFFDATTGMPDAKTFVVSNTGSASLTVDAITIQPDAGTTAFTLGTGDQGPFTLDATGGANSRTITVTYTPTHAGGDSATVTVKAGRQSHDVSLIAGTEPELVVKWLSDAGAEADPPVDFGQTPAGSKGLTRTVRLENTGTATLNVSAVTVPEDTNTAGSYSVAAFSPTAIAPGDHADVTVTFDDAVTLRNDAAKLEIVSDDPAHDASSGAYEVDLESENEPVYPPVPCISVCAHPSGSTQCSTGPSTSLELTVDASCTTDVDPNATLTYQWELALKPPASHASLDTPTNIQTRIVGPSGTKPDAVGNYVVKVTATDGYGQSQAVAQTISLSR